MTNPDAVALLDDSVKRAHKLLAGVNASQVSGATPCTEWNVQQLMDHFVDAAVYATSVVTGQQPPPPAGKTTLERFDGASAALLKVAGVPGALEKQVTGPFGPMTGAAMVLTVATDLVVHGWDLAKATGQDTKIPAALVQMAHEQYKDVPANGFPPFLGPQPAVPGNADAQTKMLAKLGRKA